MRLAWAVLLVLPTALLAGCSGEAPGDEPQSAQDNVVTDPLDYSYLQNATPGSHVHDYWQGRDRVTVLDDRDAPRSFSSTCTGGCEDGILFSRRLPADGDIVPQGTRWVNGSFTLDEEGENTWVRLELWVRTATDAEPVKWGDVRSGEPFSIEGTMERNDPPHYVLSLWEFNLVAVSGSEDVRVEGTITWTVEAVRGLPLVAFPPHPDRWNGATELDLLEETEASMLAYTDTTSGGTAHVCYNGCPARHHLGDGVIVPFETGTLQVRIAYGPGMPTGLGLTFHGANTRAFSAVAATQEAPGVTLYSIPMETGMADSPYATQSLWEFVVWVEQPGDLPIEPWSGEYTISVTAIHG